MYSRRGCHRFFRHPGDGAPAESNRAQPIGAPGHRPGSPGAFSGLEAVPALPVRPPAALGRQALAALGAAPVQHLTAIAGRHAAAEAMTGLTDPVRRLERAFHRGHSRASSGPIFQSTAPWRARQSLKRAADTLPNHPSQRQWRRRPAPRAHIFQPAHIPSIGRDVSGAHGLSRRYLDQAGRLSGRQAGST